jgi:hypothetical protein
MGAGYTDGTGRERDGKGNGGIEMKYLTREEFDALPIGTRIKCDDESCIVCPQEKTKDGTKSVRLKIKWDTRAAWLPDFYVLDEPRLTDAFPMPKVPTSYEEAIHRHATYTPERKKRNWLKQTLNIVAGVILCVLVISLCTGLTTLAFNHFVGRR